MEALDFDKVVYKWLKAGRNDLKGSEDFYSRNIFPAVVERFLSTRNAQETMVKKRYTRIISIVGFSAQLILFFHYLINPERHYFIYSIKTEAMLDRIIHELHGLSPSKWKIKIVNSSDLVNVYSKIKGILIKEKDNWQSLLIDITGGKKSMVGAAVLLGRMLDL